MTDYLRAGRLDKPLECLGFQTVGYGCTTCIGNSGPLPEPVAKAVNEGDLVAAAVLSGNRNFEGRVNPQVKANYLASPPLVVAYALAGTTDIDLATEPLGKGKRRQGCVSERHLADADEEVARRSRPREAGDVPNRAISSVWDSNPKWNRIKTSEGDLYEWHAESTYIQEPPFLIDLARRAGSRSSRSTGLGCWPRSAIRSRPITSRPPARSRPKARPEYS